MPSTRLVAHHGAPADISVDALSRLVGSRTGVEPVRISDVLLRDVSDSQQLVQLRRDLDDMHSRTIGAAPLPRSDRISQHV